MTLVVKADELSGKGAGDSALEILDYLIEVYPRSANGYWRLANLHRERPGRRLPRWQPQSLRCLWGC